MNDLISRQAAVAITDARLKDVPDTVDLEADRGLFAAGYLAAAGSIKAALERLAAPAPQPEQDAGEQWYVASESSSPEGDATIRTRGVAAPHDWIGQVKRKYAAQIVSDHRSAAAVPKLVAALENTKRCLERSDRSQLSVRKAIEKADEALTTVNQTEWHNETMSTMRTLHDARSAARRWPM